MNYRQISVAEPVLDGREAEYVMDCLRETWISSRGKYLEQFEQMLASYCGVAEAVVTNNGTTALHLALVACGISPGDEVILPALTYVASANAIRYCGAEPVFVDSDPCYLTMDPNRIEAVITDRTRAIMTVPLYGHPVDFDPIAEIAKAHNLPIVEDSAEALGASYKGHKVGSLAKCSTFSFFGNKLITTGEGGAIVTDDPQLASRMRFLRGQAVDPQRRYWHPEIGFNYRMTNVAAAIGVAQMERIDHHLGRRQRVAEWYFKFLNEHEDLLQLPYPADWAEHSYWMYTVLLNPTLGIDRDRWMKELAAVGIETRPVFYPVHWMPAYKGAKGKFPIADRCSSLGINLPTHGKLSEVDVKYICDAAIATIDALRRGQVSTQRKAA